MTVQNAKKAVARLSRVTRENETERAFMGGISAISREPIGFCTNETRLNSDQSPGGQFRPSDPDNP